jgi:aspartate aminotransferase
LNQLKPHSFRFSRRSLATPPSPIRKLAPLSLARKNDGITILPLNIGQPDIPAPKEFYVGMERALSEVRRLKFVPYEQSEGFRTLCTIWAMYLNQYIERKELNLSADNVIITMGASEAITFTLMVCCDPGDEVIVLDPTYANYAGFAATSAINLIPLPTSPENNFAFPSREVIKSSLSGKTKAILLCSPNNPTGRVSTLEELLVLYDLSVEQGLLLILDETYREIVFDNLKAFSSLDLLAKHTALKGEVFAPENEPLVIIDSVSKRYNLCGVRIGCIATRNKEIVRLLRSQVSARLAAPTLEQSAIAYMLHELMKDGSHENYINEVVYTFNRRRDTLIKSLNYELRDFLPEPIKPPNGAFYLSFELPVSGEAFAEYMLRTFTHNQKTVFVAPGAGFYFSSTLGEKMIRLAYVLNEDKLCEASQMLGLGLKEFSR